MRDMNHYLDENGVNRIFERMEELGIKSVDLARTMGYANGSYISRLKNGTMFIKLTKLDRWATALQTTPEYLMGKTDDPNNLNYVDITEPNVRKMLNYKKNMTELELRLWLKIGQDIINNRMRTKD